MPWNIMVERASILRLGPGISSGQQGEYVEESRFSISAVSPILTTHHHPTILHLKAFTSKPNPNFHHPSPFFSHFSYNSTPFALSYLIHNLGFSPLFASKLSSTYNLRFKTSHNPDLVLNFFRNHGVSDSQLRHMVAREPWLLSCDPSKRIFPKFQFFLSQGASTSDILKLFTNCPKILSPSLENRIAPTYELLLTTFFQSHHDFLAFALKNPILFIGHNLLSNVKMLIQIGVPDPRILALLRLNSEVLFTHDLMKLVREVKDMGFNPSQYNFAIALHAKRSVGKAYWKKKVDVFKKWGWSDKHVLEAFRKHPHCMLASADKIDIVMDFWVNQMGWDALAIANLPRVLVASMERKIIPRAYVVQYLLKKGLRKKKASLTSPYLASDEIFIARYIEPFKEDSSYLLKLYEEKLNLARDKDNKDGII